jgi:hypothetical protein
MVKRGLRAIVYVLFLTLFVFGALETAFRNGWVPNAAYATKRRARAEGGELKVLVLGDSFSVEDPTPFSLTLGNQLRTYFESHHATEITMAHPGYGPQDYLDSLNYFRSYGPDFQPDLVMINYYVGNDLTDEKYRIGKNPEASRVEILDVPGGAWLEHSYLLRHLGVIKRDHEFKNNFDKLKKTLTAPPSASPSPLASAPPPPPPSLPSDVPAPSLTPMSPERPAARQAARQAAQNPYLLDMADHDPNFLEHNLLLDDPEDRAAWVAVEGVLREIAAYAKSQHARLLINIFSSTLQVNDSRYSFYEDVGFTMDRRLLSSTIPQDLMKQFCTEEGVTCNDLLPLFRRHADAELYMDHDDHWVTAGHTLAFEGIRVMLEADPDLGPRLR